MLEQEKKTGDAAVAQSVVQQPASAPQVVTPAPVVVAPQYQQTCVPPQVTYVQAAPAPLIVMRDSSPRLADYGIYPPRMDTATLQSTIIEATAIIVPTFPSQLDSVPATVDLVFVPAVSVAGIARDYLRAGIEILHLTHK